MRIATSEEEKEFETDESGTDMATHSLWRTQRNDRSAVSLNDLIVLKKQE